MRRWLVPVLILALPTTAVGCGGASAGGSTPSARSASLRPAGEHPNTLRGTGFKAGEHVTVSVAGVHAARRVVVGADGRFSVVISGVSPNECTGVSATAVGDHGSRASFKRAPGQCALP